VNALISTPFPFTDRPKTFFVYTLLAVGLPFFFGMFIGSFVGPAVSKLLAKSRWFEDTHLQGVQLVNGFAVAGAGAFLFKLSGLPTSLIVPGAIAAWISAYCLVSRQHMSDWVNWIGGLMVGWLALGI
jgi:hypothetical protein